MGEAFSTFFPICGKINCRIERYVVCRNVIILFDCTGWPIQNLQIQLAHSKWKFVYLQNSIGKKFFKAANFNYVQAFISRIKSVEYLTEVKLCNQSVTLGICSGNPLVLLLLYLRVDKVKDKPLLPTKKVAIFCALTP